MKRTNQNPRTHIKTLEKIYIYIGIGIFNKSEDEKILQMGVGGYFKQEKSRKNRIIIKSSLFEWWRLDVTEIKEVVRFPIWSCRMDTTHAAGRGTRSLPHGKTANSYRTFESVPHLPRSGSNEEGGGQVTLP